MTLTQGKLAGTVEEPNPKISREANLTEIAFGKSALKPTDIYAFLCTLCPSTKTAIEDLDIDPIIKNLKNVHSGSLPNDAAAIYCSRLIEYAYMMIIDGSHPGFWHAILSFIFQGEILEHKNPSKAAFHASEGVQHGFPRSFHQYGMCHLYGIGVAPDFTKALKLFHQGAEMSDSASSWQIGKCFQNGIGVAKDMKKALMWWELAAEQGSAAALNSIGVCFEEGLGVQQDTDRAAEFLELAASLGHPSALFNMALRFESRLLISQRMKAIDYYKRGAKIGHLGCMYNLGVTYIMGDMCPQNIQKGIKLYRRCAARGVPEAKCALGDLLLSGKYITKDETQAFDLFNSAARQNCASAFTSLGWCHWQGLGVKKNLAKAFEAFQAARNLGDLLGSHHLATFYRDGLCVRKNIPKAITLLTEASNGGILVADIALKKIYLEIPEWEWIDHPDLLMLLLLARRDPGCLFFFEYFPLDLFKVIVDESSLGCFQPLASSKVVSKKQKIENFC